MFNATRCTLGGLLLGSIVVAGSADASPTAKKPSMKQKAGTGATAARDYVQEGILNAGVRVAMLRNLERADGMRVKISVKGSRVTLGGEVRARSSLKLANEVARSVSGVEHVQSRIRLNPSAAHQDDVEAFIKDQILATDLELRLLTQLGAAILPLTIFTK